MKEMKEGKMDKGYTYLTTKGHLKIYL